MTSEERRDYLKEYYDRHREERVSYQKKYYAEHREEQKARTKKYASEHRTALTDQQRHRRKEHPEYLTYMKEYKARDLNSNGVTKTSIRAQSRALLFKTHARLQEYQIHHCFGYEDPSKFIYIPRSLHYQIHQVLRDLNIPADSDHWNIIRDLVNSCEEYTYIRC